jgi:hypothetical protein
VGAFGHDASEAVKGWSNGENGREAVTEVGSDRRKVPTVVTKAERE